MVLLVVAGAVAATDPLWSQSSSPPRAPDTTPVQPDAACPPGVGPEAPTVGSGRADTNLSDRLAKSGGIICPPASRDSEMAVPPPDDSGRMPVIRPPGTPGGDQSVQPK